MGLFLRKRLSPLGKEHGLVINEPPCSGFILNKAFPPLNFTGDLLYTSSAPKDLSGEIWPTLPTKDPPNTAFDLEDIDIGMIFLDKSKTTVFEVLCSFEHPPKLRVPLLLAEVDFSAVFEEILLRLSLAEDCLPCQVSDSS